MAVAFIGVIGGSGLYDIPGLEITGSEKISTPYGDPSDIYRLGMLSGNRVAFLPRHGSVHHIQPHRINYRANIWGFRELGVRKILSVNASGGIDPALKPGDIVVPDQVIDMTSGRQSTFYDEDEVIHIDFTGPFCQEIRKYLILAAEKAGVAVRNGGTYLCTNGPRLETAAEVQAYDRLGAHLVGMTVMPEAVLARELEICFAGISVITNYAAGIAKDRLTTTEVIETMHLTTEKIKSAIEAFFTLEFAEPSCACGTALRDARM